MEQNNILFIGVGEAGRKVIKKISEQHIPNSQCMSFGNLTEDDACESSGPPHYNILELNDIYGDWHNSPVSETKNFTERVQDKIKNIIINSLLNKKGT